jgi:MerR family redox-sensitive transcriptional activator SoxR
VTLAIGEVAQRSGIPATTLRYYEEVGLIARPNRVAGRRQYAEDVLDVLTVVSAARRAGVSLAEVRVMLDTLGYEGPGPAWRNLSTYKRSQLLDQIHQLEQMVQLLDAIATCECDSLTACASRLRADLGSGVSL